MAIGKIPKVWKWIIGVLLMTLISTQIIIQFFVAPVIEKAIAHNIQQASNGLYQVDSIDVDLVYLDRTFIINDLYLSYDSLQFEKRKDSGLARPTLFNLFIPRLEVKVLNVIEAYKHKNYFIQSVEIIEPDLDLINYKNLSANRKKAPRVDQLYNLISGSVKGLYIEEIKISSGKFKLNDPDQSFQNAFEAKDISISVKNFKLDSTTVPELDRPFYADEISASVNVSDYSYVLPDSSYSIKAGKLGISTLTGEIFAEEFQIEPKSLVLSDSSEIQGPNSQFNIFIPRLQIEKTGFHNAYFERDLNLGNIRIIEPQITQLGKVVRDSIQADSLDPAEIFEKIAPIFNQITVDQLSIEDGTFHRVGNWQDSTGAILLEGIGLKLNRLRFDSAMLKPDRRLFLSDELVLSMKKYQFSLSKNNYSLEGEDAFLSSISGKLSAKKLNFFPYKEKYQKAYKDGGDLVKFQIPTLQIDGLDLSQAWYDRVMNVESFTINKPEIELLNLPKVEKETIDSLAKVNLYSLVSGFLNSFAINSFRINNGRFNFNYSNKVNENEFIASDINVNIKNFKLAPEIEDGSQNPFYADDIAIKGNIEDYSFILPDSSYTVQARSIGISTADSAIFADSILINPVVTRGQRPTDQNYNQANIIVPHVYLSGLDISQIWFNKFLDVDSIGIAKPSVVMNSQIYQPNKVEFKSLKEINLYPYIESRLNALKVKTFHIDSAEFVRHRTKGDYTSKLHLPTVSLDINGFYLDSATRIGPENLLYSENIEVNIGKANHVLPDSSHILSIEGLNLSTQSGEIKISNINMNPLDSALTKNQYQVEIPSIDIKGLNSFDLYEDKVLDVKKVQVNFPRVSLTNYPYLERENIDSLAKSDLYLLISDQLNSLEIRSLVVLGGNFDLNEDNSLSENNFTAEDIMVLITNFRLDSAAREKTNNPFYADDIDVSININDYSFMLKDSTYSIKVGNIGISTADSSILAERVQITPQLSNSKINASGQIFDVFLPSIKLKGLNTKQVYFDREVDLEKIELNRPQIKMFSRKKIEKKDTLDIYETISKELDLLKINKISLDNGVFEQVYPEGDQRRPLFLPRFSLEMEQFKFDSIAPITAGRFLYSNNITFEVKDYSIPVKDSIYTLAIDNISFTTEDSRIVFDSLSLKSNLGIKDFHRKNGYAMDHIQLVAHQISGENVDLFALADRNAIDILKLNVKGLRVKVDKDKRLNTKLNKRPLLPVDLLQSIPVYLRIDSTVIDQAELRYKERVASLMDPGEIEISRINAIITQITNDPNLFIPEKKTNLEIKGEAYIMDEGKLDLTIIYPLADTANQFTMEGSLGPMSMTLFNPILMPAASVSVKGGQANEMTFKVKGDEHQTRGRMWFKYDDLKVEVLNEKETDSFKPKVKKRGFLSALANTVVVRTKNPNRRFLRVGKIEYEVDRSKGFVAHWMQSLISGMKSSIGLGKGDDRDRTQR